MKKPKPPFTHLRCLGKELEIQWNQELMGHFGVFGTFEPVRMVVRLGTGHSEDQTRETLLHEVMHAVEHQMNLQITEENIRQLSVGLYAMLKDNPRFAAFLCGAQ